MKAKNQLLSLGILFMSIVCGPLTMQAQPAKLIDTGTVLNDIQFKDIYGKAFSLFSKLDEGYTVVIELGLTTCPICWSVSKSGIPDRLYENYGPTGKISPKKILPMFIECNPSTTDADLRGTGSNTQGDWVTGREYPIVDLTSENFESTLRNFFPSGMLSFTTPTFLVVCPDRKVVFTGVGAAAGITEPKVVNIMKGECATVGVEAVAAPKNAVSVVLYPNPVIDFVNIQIEAALKAAGTLRITNLMGQVLYTEDIMLQTGEQMKSIQTKNLASGFYLFSVVTDQGTVIKQFVKK